MRKLYAIGDIHGCYDALSNLLEKISLDKGDDLATIVFLGDYVDRGPDSYKVIDLLIKLQESSRRPGAKTDYVFLKGNHEEMMLGGIHKDSWYYNGGFETIESYKSLPNWENVLETHKQWMKENLKTLVCLGPYAFVHAGLNPLCPLDNQDENDMIWDRTFNSWSGEFPSKLFVVHGHTPVSTPDLKPWQLNIDTGCVFGKDYPEKYGKLTAVRLPDDPKSRDFVFFQSKQLW